MSTFPYKAGTTNRTAAGQEYNTDETKVPAPAAASDTPRTDAAELECGSTYGSDPLQYLCRTLERELAAANAEIERLKK